MNPSFVSSSSPHNMLDMISKNTLSISVVQEINTEDAATTNYHQLDQLFDKALTPSDVGKLNRLVIPKQYAEKYFPLRSVCGRSSSSGETLLSFEDEMGKVWRFRYSYWTSSQSYVLTKGWSRYVKAKGLTAGDIVTFQRQQCNGVHRLFITWRTRANSTAAVQRIKYNTTTAFFPAPQPYCPTLPTMNLAHKYTGGENKMVSICNTPRRLRLFGVNMEFTESESSNVSSDALTLNHGAAQLYTDPHTFKVIKYIVDCELLDRTLDGTGIKRTRNRLPWYPKLSESSNSETLFNDRIPKLHTLSHIQMILPLFLFG